MARQASGLPVKLAVGLTAVIIAVSSCSPKREQPSREVIAARNVVDEYFSPKLRAADGFASRVGGGSKRGDWTIKASIKVEGPDQCPQRSLDVKLPNGFRRTPGTVSIQRCPPDSPVSGLFRGVVDGIECELSAGWQFGTFTASVACPALT
jgi:hypothetical protein